MARVMRFGGIVLVVFMYYPGFVAKASAGNRMLAQLVFWPSPL